jgi:hypothetical protein
MRLPLPFLLYVVAVGLFGWAGWTCYETLPMWQKSYRDDASQSGIKTSYKLLAQGQVNVPVVADWRYDNGAWWQGFKRVNLVGKLPEKPKSPAEIEAEQPQAPPVDMRPLDEIIELVSLVYDGKEGGKGGDSHVIVRYRPEANVEPPEWWVRENSPPGSSAAGYSPPDRIGAGAARNGRGFPTGSSKPKTTPTTTAMPRSTTGREILQKLWLDQTDARHGANLWPPFAHIRVVRVASDAQAAYFVRGRHDRAGLHQPAHADRLDQLRAVVERRSSRDQKSAVLIPPPLVG